MSFLENLEYDKDIIVESNLFFHGQKQFIGIQKSKPSFNKTDQYFFKSFYNEGGNTICQGYIYFYLDKENKKSEFIGIYVKPEYRGEGIASLLIAEWINFCLNNNYEFLSTNRRQRKPFMLYLLKTYGFEINIPNIYKEDSFVIDIARKNNDSTKYLIFKNKGQEQSFMQGKIALEDNYQAISALDIDMSYLDSVILSRVYDLENLFIANEKTQLVLKRHR